MKNKAVIRDVGKLLVIDSTTISMSLSQYPWATFRKTKAGVRIHLKVVVTKECTMPEKAVLLPAKHADRLPLFRKPTRKSKGRKAYNWEEEFQLIATQYERGEIEHLNELTYDPIFI